MVKTPMDKRKSWPKNPLRRALRYGYVLDACKKAAVSPLEQANTALLGGASHILYRHDKFGPADFAEAKAVKDLCCVNGLPFVVFKDLLAARALEADGIHFEHPHKAMTYVPQILEPHSLVGVSVSDPGELSGAWMSLCRYIGVGNPATKWPGNCDGRLIKAVGQRSSLPVVGFGFMTPDQADEFFRYGAAGVAVSHSPVRPEKLLPDIKAMAAACGQIARKRLRAPWQDEFALIRKLLSAAASKTEGGASPLIVPPGDDACLLKPLKRPVISTDTQKEGIHFRLQWQSPAEIGRKAVAVTLSDLAASYARPVCLFINLGLPSYISDQSVLAIYKGIGQALKQYACALGGGNISKDNVLSLDLFAIGEGEGAFPQRSAARPGDGLFCTGPLGLARAGLESLIRNDPEFSGLVKHFKSPAARFDAARILSDNGVRCVMDISDGAAGDAGHIASASGISVEFLDIKAHASRSLSAFCKKYGLDAVEMMLSGGEDYELLFTAPGHIYERIRKALPGAFQLGKCLPFMGQAFVNLPSGVATFQHGQRPSYHTSKK